VDSHNGPFTSAFGLNDPTFSQRPIPGCWLNTLQGKTMKPTLVYVALILLAALLYGLAHWAMITVASPL
jgi:hypothetical protein